MEPNTNTCALQSLTPIVVGNDLYNGLNIILQLRAELAEAEQELANEIKKHNQRARTLFDTQFKASGLAWCTNCEQMHLRSEFLLLNWKQASLCSGGYEGGGRQWQTDERLLYVCSNCAITMRGAAYTGPEQGYGIGRDHERIEVTRVLARDDVSRMTRYQAPVLPAISPQYVKAIYDRYAEEWRLIPEIKIDSAGTGYVQVYNPYHQELPLEYR